MLTTRIEVQLATIVAHLAEYLSEDGDLIDLQAAQSVLKGEVLDQLELMRENGLLPISRSGKTVYEMIHEPFC